MARRNDNTAGRVLTWFVAAFLIIATVAGVKFVLDNDLKRTDDVSSLVVPVPSEPSDTSETPPASSEENQNVLQFEIIATIDVSELEVDDFEKEPYQAGPNSVYKYILSTELYTFEIYSISGDLNDVTDAPFDPLFSSSGVYTIGIPDGRVGVYLNDTEIHTAANNTIGFKKSYGFVKVNKITIFTF